MAKSKKQEIVEAPVNQPTISMTGKHPNLKQPGDKITQEVTKSGTKVVTKLDTAEKKATLVQHFKKDGTPGKKVGYIMEPKK